MEVVEAVPVAYAVLKPDNMIIAFVYLVEAITILSSPMLFYLRCEVTLNRTIVDTASSGHLTWERKQHEGKNKL